MRGSRTQTQKVTELMRSSPLAARWLKSVAVVMPPEQPPEMLSFSLSVIEQTTPMTSTSAAT